jgi:surface protein
MNEVVIEERYAFVLNLYLIRKQYRRMGLFQPDFLSIIFGSLMSGKSHRSDNDIHTAVNAWCNDHTAAELKYGNISKWNTSLVTDMNGLFRNRFEFNDDISKWDVSSVTDMSHMFLESSFNGDISGWNVSSVTNMDGMFAGARSFDGDLTRWDVSNVTNMHGMFMNTLEFTGNKSISISTRAGANKISKFSDNIFDCDSDTLDVLDIIDEHVISGSGISTWNVSNVTNMMRMFCRAYGFNGDISNWNTEKVEDMEEMFRDATSFDGNISNWDVDVTDISGMFRDHCPIPREHKPYPKNW